MRLASQEDPVRVSHMSHQKQKGIQPGETGDKEIGKKEP